MIDQDGTANRPLKIVVLIDLSAADLDLFEAYEAAVLPLVPEHGGSLDARVRSLDGTFEFHLLSFPSPGAFDRFRADPRRERLESERSRCMAAFDVRIVTDVPQAATIARPG